MGHLAIRGVRSSVCVFQEVHPVGGGAEISWGCVTVPCAVFRGGPVCPAIHTRDQDRRRAASTKEAPLKQPGVAVAVRFAGRALVPGAELSRLAILVLRAVSCLAGAFVADLTVSTLQRVGARRTLVGDTDLPAAAVASFDAISSAAHSFQADLP